MDSSSKPPKLKFGVDRLLSPDVPRVPKEHEPQGTQILYPKPTMAVPCSDCVSSLLRCCRLGPNHEFGQYAPIQVPQPVRPYANTTLYTRPNIQVASTQPQIQNQGKRKRSWSRAVFSNLQRKGLERRFQIQKYITKPDRRQLAATLGLTDAQVKVWFQNRRMKWRHSKESSKGENNVDSTQENLHIDVDSTD